VLNTHQFLHEKDPSIQILFHVFQLVHSQSATDVHDKVCLSEVITIYMQKQSFQLRAEHGQLYVQYRSKNDTIFVHLIISPNIKQFSKFFHWQNQETICNKTITINSTTPQVCSNTTSWNVSFLKITIKNETTSATTHLKKLTTKTTCLLSQLLSKKSYLTVYMSNV